MSEMKPCPFCLGPAVEWWDDSQDYKRPCWIGCQNSGCFGPQDNFRTERAAQEIWNTRTPEGEDK